MGDIQIGTRRRGVLEGFLANKTFVLAGGSLLGLLFVVAVVTGDGPAPRIAPPAVSSAAPGVETTPVHTFFVHVAGEVRHPGLYEVSEGARVADAIAAAGGATRKADLDLLNLAQLVTDGLKVDVPREGRAPTTVAPGSSGAPSPGVPISLNSADQIALETVPGIGPVRAAAIIAYREAHGGFDSVEELLDVQGIGPATLAAIRELVTL